MTISNLSPTAGSQAWICTMCSKRSCFRCDVCKETSFCSKACAEADATAHRLICETSKTLPLDYPAALRVALYSDMNDSSPYQIWSPINESLAPRRAAGDPMPPRMLLRPDLRGLFGRGQRDWTYMSSLTIDGNAACGRLRFAGYRQRVWFRDDHLNDGSEPNEAVARAVGGRERLGHDWRGPVLVARLRLGEDGKKSVEDMPSADFRDVVDWLAEYGRTKGAKVDLGEPLSRTSTEETMKTGNGNGILMATRKKIEGMAGAR